MKLIHYAPVVGMPFALHDIITSDEPFQIQCHQAAQVGATQAALTVSSMGTSIFAAKKAQTIARIGLAAPGVIASVPFIAATAFIGAVIYTGMREPTRTDTSLRVRPQHSEYYHRSSGY